MKSNFYTENQHKKRWLNKIFFLAIFVLFSCECVPTIDSQNIIEPTEFSKVAFINLLEDVNFINIYQKNINVIDSIKNAKFYDFAANIQLQKIESGITNIGIFNSKISNSESPGGSILSFIADVELNKYYSAIICGTSNFAKCLFVCDTTARISESLAGVRFVNLGEETIFFHLGDKNISLTANSLSELHLFESKILELELSDKMGKIISLSQLELRSNTIYNIIFNSANNKIAIFSYSL